MARPTTLDRGHDQSLTFTNRLFRALCHHLRLLNRSGSTFHVLGATGNVYVVTLTSAPTCTCPDRATPCKHILFVLLRVLSLPLHHPALRRPDLLRPSHLLTLPTSPDSLAGPRTRQRFHQLFSASTSTTNHPPETVSPQQKKGEVCPVCLDEMGEEKVVVHCRVCKNGVHEKCFARWRRSGSGLRRGGATCVMCRARWRDHGSRRDERGQRAGRYVNLAVYAQEEEDNHSESCAPLLLPNHP